jgi:hypothetical protein
VEFKSRVVPGVLIGGVVLAGGGSVIAASGGSSSKESAASTQYCPDGTPKPPSGDCSGHGGNPGGPPEHKPPKHKHKKPKFHVHRHPRHGCYRGNIAFRIGVENLPKRHKTRVYRDGRFVTMSGKKSFKVRFDTSRMRSGLHTLTLRLRGSDGKWYTWHTRFRHC